MRVALIPPRGLENVALASKFHLALAIPELIGRRTYGGMYRRASASLGDYVVLDNGANEGQTASSEILCDLARGIGAHEVVAPDVLFDMKNTIIAVKDFFQRIGELPGRKVMAVLQGTTIDELKVCAGAFCEIRGVVVVGIPRHLIETLDRAAVRIDLANWIDRSYPKRFEIHLLGTNPAWRAEVAAAAKYAEHIRSVDTSMPFNYALADRSLASATDAIRRPERYFQQDWSNRIDMKLLRENIRTIMEWANAPWRDDEEASKGGVRVVSAS